MRSQPLAEGNAPSAFYGRTGRESVSEKAYPSLDQFFADMGDTYRKAVRAFAVADILFNRIKTHGYFIEYDTERAGEFEPLRYLPKGRSVVLGLVTTKSGQLEEKDTIKRRIDEAAKFVDLDQVCLSPQVRLCLARRRQHAGPGRAMGEASHDCRNCRRGVGVGNSDFLPTKRPFGKWLSHHPDSCRLIWSARLFLAMRLIVG